MNIILVGYRGVGKTTVAQKLARSLGRELIRTDLLVEQNTGMPLPLLIKTRGWNHFRDIESSVLQSLSLHGSLRGAVIDTGGGIVLKKSNIQQLRSLGVVIWLREDITLIYKRIKASVSQRPPLTSLGLEEEITQTYSYREPLYQHAADYVVDGDAKSPTIIAKHIISLLKQHIKALIFDYGDVLIHYKDETLIRELSTVFKVPYATMEPLFYKFIPSLQRGRISEETFFKRISHSLKKPSPLVSPYQYMCTEFIRNAVLNTEMISLIKKLKRRYRLGLLSNIEKSHRDASLTNKHFAFLGENFNPVVFSCDVHMRKPEKRIYAYTLNQLALPARNCLFIDDREINLAPAKKLGIHTILFKDYPTFCDNLKTFFING